jgi:hypothetical protein
LHRAQLLARSGASNLLLTISKPGGNELQSRHRGIEKVVRQEIDALGGIMACAATPGISSDTNCSAMVRPGLSAIAVCIGVLFAVLSNTSAILWFSRRLSMTCC